MKKAATFKANQILSYRLGKYGKTSHFKVITRSRNEVVLVELNHLGQETSTIINARIEMNLKGTEELITLKGYGQFCTISAKDTSLLPSQYMLDYLINK